MLLKLFVAICLFWACDGQYIGDANTPGARGEEVVKEVLNIIDDKQIFPFDNNFTLYVALLESDFGREPDCYYTGYNGGIWQVDQDLFEKTKNVQAFPKLRGMLAKVKKAFGIDWSTVEWEQLRVPLYSGLAAKLLYFSQQEFVPQELEKRANGVLIESVRIVLERIVIQCIFIWGRPVLLRIRYTQIVIQYYRITILCYDPHLLQVLDGSAYPFCYDVFGRNGEQFNVITDPSNGGISITAELMSTEPMAKYISKFSISANGGAVVASGDNQGITVNGVTYDWNTPRNEYIDEEKTSYYAISGGVVSFVIYGSIYTQVKINTETQYLDLGIADYSPADVTIGGIIGEFAKHLSIEDSSAGAQLKFSKDDGTEITSGLQHTDMCWRTDSPSDAMTDAINDLIQQNCLTC